MPTVVVSFSQSFVAALGSVWARMRVFAIAHKIWSAIIAIAVVGAGWYAYGAITNTSGVPRYVLAQVQQGTFIASVTGTGQVSASSAVALTPQASGQLVSINVKDGQQVSKGQLIAAVDPTTALSGVASAKADLQSAQLALAKLTEAPTALASAQAQDAVSGAYNSSRSDLVATYLDLQNIMVALKDINGYVGGNTFVSSVTGAQGQADRQTALAAYDNAYSSYESAFTDYSAVTISSADSATVEKLLKETLGAATDVGNAVKAESAFLQWDQSNLESGGQTVPATVTTDLSDLNTYASEVGTHLSALTSDQSNVTQNNLSLQQLQTGADPIDIQSDQLAIAKAQNALQTAENTLANYYVRAPFAGQVALGSPVVGQQVGSSDTIATVITQNQFADITLNEVDAAKIQAGDPATITFSAISGLTIAGSVADIAPIGTVSSGVVSYTVKVGFATQDAHVKPGMSVSVNIVTKADPNVLLVSSSAVQSASGSNYVLAFNPPLATSTVQGSSAPQGITTAQTPVAIPVTVGATNNTQTEITAGLSAGQQIIVRTITGSSGSTAAATPTTSAGSAPAIRIGGGGGGGAVFRGGGG